jgi:hypothetical protein
MLLTYNHTFAVKGGVGVENFGRNAPPTISVYATKYALAVRKNLVPVLAEATQLPGLYNMFCYQDEPFHAGPESFDQSEEARHQFRKRFGYDLPLDVGATRNSPREWLDLINFQSDVTEDRNVKFQVLNKTIVFDTEAPRQKPQLLRLLASRNPRQSV